MKNRAATCCSWLRCVFAALILIASQSVSLAQAGALTFSAASQQYVSVPDFDTLDVTTEVTVEFWARFTTTAPSQTAFGIEPDVIGNRFLAHLFGLGENIYWDFGDIQNGGRISFPNSGGPAVGWTHYAFVASQSGNFMKIYIDGVQAASVASFNAFETTAASTLRIGSGSGDYFDGSIDEFRVWNVARSPAQIAAARTGTLVGDEPGLRLYFKFDEAGGDIAVNSATATLAAYNGTLVNGAARIGIHTVTSTAVGGQGSLRQVVFDAASGDTIFFDSTVFATAQIITLHSEIPLNKSVTIDASARSSQVTISGGDLFRIFTVNTVSTVALKGLTLTGGGGTGTESSNNGGAIFNQGTLTLTQCTLSGNDVTGNGGAILNRGELALTRCTLAGNLAYIGGAIVNDDGTNAALTLTQCTLSGNSASFGGAIFNFSALTLTQCTFSGNSVGANGGAIYNAPSVLSVFDNAALTLTQCTLSGNSAPYHGGAIMNYSPLTLTQCTLYGNSADAGGGAIYNELNTVTLTNSVVAGSIASPEDLYNSPRATLTRVGANLVQSFTNDGALRGSGTISNSAPLLAPLGDYGGPMQTMALLPGSPARNAAAVLVPAITGDQRGFPIIGTPDIGAYEAGTFTNYNAWIYETLPAAATGPQHASTADYDGDGVTNGNEWPARTDPGDSANYFHITQSIRTGNATAGAIGINFPSVIGRNYIVEYSTDLISWKPSGTPLAGTGNLLTLVLSYDGYSRLFVRARVGP